MKLNKIGFPVLFLVSASAFASPKLFTQTFDLSGVHYTLRFTADDASPAVVTALADSFAGADPLTLLAPGGMNGNDNLFDPAAVDPALGGGWGLFGIGFRDTVTHLDYNLYNNFDPSPYLLSSDASANGVTASFSTAAASTVDEPAMPGLFALAALAAFGSRRRVRLPSA